MQTVITHLKNHCRGCNLNADSLERLVLPLSMASSTALIGLHQRNINSVFTIIFLTRIKSREKAPALTAAKFNGKNNELRKKIMEESEKSTEITWVQGSDWLTIQLEWRRHWFEVERGGGSQLVGGGGGKVEAPAGKVKSTCLSSTHASSASLHPPNASHQPNSTTLQLHFYSCTA